MKRHMAISLLILLMSAACSGPITPPAPTASANPIDPVATIKAPVSNAQPTLPPIASPALPPQQPTPAPIACVNDSKFVEDLSVPDGTHFAPGMPFDKSWRIQNTGTCPWDTTYQYRLIAGVSLVGQNITLPQVVPPGEMLDITIKMVSPMTAGTYRGQWRLFAPGDVPFGQRPFVEIIVP